MRAAYASVQSRDDTTLVVYGLASLYPDNNLRSNVDHLFAIQDISRSRRGPAGVCVTH